MEHLSSVPNQPVPNRKPEKISAIGIMTLINGILNILGGLVLTAAAVILTLGLGLLITPFTILPVVLGVFEILYAVKILASPPQPVQFSQTIAILEICCILYGNFISLIVGILALVFYSEQPVKDYFAALNSPNN